jgi:hypothetical protein
MSNPAFLVEGVMEQRFIRYICPDKAVRLIGCNGKKASMKTISTFIERHIKSLGNRHYPIVIILDREQRVEKCSELIDDLTKELEKKGD